MNDELLMDAVTQLDDDIVEEAVENRTKWKVDSRKMRIRMIAAGLVFAIIGSYLGHIRVFSPRHILPQYNAMDVRSVFGETLSGSTNAYTVKTVTDPKYLNINPPFYSGFLPVYEHRLNPTAYTESQLRKFIDPIKEKMESAMDYSFGDYKVSIHGEDEKYLIESKYEFDWDTVPFYFNARQDKGSGLGFEYNYTAFQVSRINSTSFALDSRNITIKKEKSDTEIILSLLDVRVKLYSIFGVVFPDAKVVRNFDDESERETRSISVYFYDSDAHPLNHIGDPYPGNIPLYSDHICLTFDYVDSDVDHPDGQMMTLDQIRYIDMLDSPYANYKAVSNERQLTLWEAEKLLEKGYVFGGHSCPLCMKEQPEVDFSDYDYVGIEYVFRSIYYGDPAIGIPFYTFYKEIEPNKNGTRNYAKTYVPAIAIKGLDAFFENRIQSHKS